MGNRVWDVVGQGFGVRFHDSWLQISGFGFKMRVKGLRFPVWILGV